MLTKTHTFCSSSVALPSAFAASPSSACPWKHGHTRFQKRTTKGANSDGPDASRLLFLLLFLIFCLRCGTRSICFSFCLSFCSLPLETHIHTQLCKGTTKGSSRDDQDTYLLWTEAVRLWSIPGIHSMLMSSIFGHSVHRSGAPLTSHSIRQFGHIHTTSCPVLGGGCWTFGSSSMSNGGCWKSGLSCWTFRSSSVLGFGMASGVGWTAGFAL